ncbi:MAG: divergent PAP2 family protein [Erysipelotrichaceae bacterium]|nr:divergent PAP2 family protein [Erysipelotrichaceae bacterium]
MFEYMYPFWASLIALVTAQFLKPILHLIKYKEWDIWIARESGGFPSSHSSLVSALTLAVGFREGFSSVLFAVTASFSIIIIYDAANVRYYSGQNIQITQQLIKDFQKITNNEFDNPIYHKKLKDVLGHRWFEVFGGIIWGVIISSIMYYWFK